MSKFACWALIALFVSNLYVVFENLGEMMAISMAYHFLGGFFVAMLFASFYNSEFSRLSQPRRLLTIVALTVAVGVFWEMAEYVGNKKLSQPIYDVFHYRVYFMGNLDDTIQDLVMDTLGAAAFALASTLNLFKRVNSQKGEAGG